MSGRVKNLINNIRLECSWIFTSKSPARPITDDTDRRFLILLTGTLRPTERRSFGDEIMFLAICKHIHRTTPKASITILRFEGSAGETYNFYGHRIREIAFPAENYVSPSSYKEFRKIATGFSDVYLIGADCLDGAYWRRQSIQIIRFMNLAGQMGLRSRILGFSYNGNKDALIRKELRKAASHCTLCVRDAISKERLEEFIPTDAKSSRNIQLVADLAFPVDASSFPVPTLDVAMHERLKSWKNKGVTIVAINICGWHWKNPEVFIARLSHHLLKLAEINPQTAYLLLPHDNREGKISDVHTLSLLNDQLKVHHKRVIFCNSLASGVQAKQLVSHADVLITGRMHLAIAALSQNIPTISLVYQGKFEGLYDHYKFDNRYYFEPDDLENIFETLDKVLENREEISRHIRLRNTEIFRLSEKNFSE